MKSIQHFLIYIVKDQFSSVHSLSCVRLFETPWTAACPASLSITNSRSSIKLKDSLVIPFYIHIQLPSSLPLSPLATMHLLPISIISSVKKWKYAVHTF